MRMYMCTAQPASQHASPWKSEISHGGETRLRERKFTFLLNTKEGPKYPFCSPDNYNPPQNQTTTTTATPPIYFLILKCNRASSECMCVCLYSGFSSSMQGEQGWCGPDGLKVWVRGTLGDSRLLELLKGQECETHQEESHTVEVYNKIHTCQNCKHWFVSCKSQSNEAPTTHTDTHEYICTRYTDGPN